MFPYLKCVKCGRTKLKDEETGEIIEPKMQLFVRWRHTPKKVKVEKEKVKNRVPNKTKEKLITNMLLEKRSLSSADIMYLANKMKVAHKTAWNWVRIVQLNILKSQAVIAKYYFSQIIKPKGG